MWRIVLIVLVVLLHNSPVPFSPKIVAEAIHVDTSGCTPVVPLMRCYGIPKREEGKAGELEELKSTREPNNRHAEEDSSDKIKGSNGNS